MAYNPNNANGNTTAANSAPVTIASDNNGPVKVWDGTNTAAVVPITQAGQNSLPTVGAFRDSGTGTAAALNADILPSTDISNMPWVSVTIGSSTYAGTIGFQGSNDNFATTYTVPLARVDVIAGGSNSVSTSSVNIAYGGYVPYRYFRVRMISYTSGTATGVVQFRSIPSGHLGTQLSVNATTTPSSTNTYSGDALSSSTGGQTIYAMNGIQGASSLIERQRSISAVPDGNNAIGLTAAANILYNGTSFDRQRNNIAAAVIAAGATTTQTSAAVTTYNAAKLAVIINISAFSSGTLTFTITGQTSSGYTYPILVSAALAAAGTTVLRVFPGATASANAVANDLLPRSFVVTVSGTFSATYGVDYILSV